VGNVQPRRNCGDTSRDWNGHVFAVKLEGWGLAVRYRAMEVKDQLQKYKGEIAACRVARKDDV